MPCSLSCVAVQPITHVARALTPPPPPPFAPYRSPPFPQMTRRLNFSTGTEVQRDILRLLSERYEIDASGAAVQCLWKGAGYGRRGLTRRRPTLPLDPFPPPERKAHQLLRKLAHGMPHLSRVNPCYLAPGCVYHRSLRPIARGKVTWEHEMCGFLAPRRRGRPK